MPDREQKSMVGCFLWSGLGVILLYASVVFFGVGARVLAILPAWVGVVKQIEAEEVIHFDTPGTTEATFHEGPHMIISQYRFAAHHFEIVSVDSNQLVPIEKETHEIKYELEQLGGYLVYHFNIPQDGRYRITEEVVKDNTVQIAPNYSVRNQIAIFLFYGVLVGGIVLFVWLWRRPKIKAEIAERKTSAQTKAAKWDALTNAPENGQNE